jgi:hypothetical protein
MSIFMRKKLNFFFIFIPPSFPVSMVLQGRQNMNKSMYLGSFQNKICFQNKFLFLFCPPLKYFSY